MAEELENKQGQEDTTITETKKTYSEEEVQALLQKEGDRRISQYMKTLEKKNREAEKLASMNDTEKFEYQLKQRELAIEEKERQLTLAENKNVASKILSEKGLSLDLVDFVLAEEADTMDANIKRLEKAFKKSVTDEVTKRLGSKAPKVTDTPDVMTKETFKKLSLSEKQHLYDTDRELYNSLKS